MVKYASAHTVPENTLLRGYSVRGAVLDRSARLHQQHPARVPPREAAAIAMNLQAGQNREDAAWLKELGLPREIEEALICRMMARGACWLELVESLVGFTGDYRFMRK